MDLTTYFLVKGANLITGIENNIPICAQEKVFDKLLFKASKTAFGRNYHFQEIINSPDRLKAFQDLVPIHNYNDMYNEWWADSLTGVRDVTWRNKVDYFALSSGTSGSSSKYIPVTNDMQKSMRKSALNVLKAVDKIPNSNKIFNRKWLAIGGSASLKKHNDSWVGDLSGINNLRSPFWTKRMKKPGIDIAKIENWDERTDAIARHAKKWDISALVGIPSWVQLTLEKVISYHQVKNIHEIWPNLSLFVTGGINFEPYRKSFESLLDKPISYLDTYLASEGFLAYQSDPHDPSMQLILNEGIFYEFIPFNEANFTIDGNLQPGVRPLTIDQVEEGVDYALVISTCAGAWRYLIGDTVRFTNSEKGKILITGRTSQFLSVCGEHVSIENLNQAVKNVNQNSSCEIQEFAVGAFPSEGHYYHHWYVGSGHTCDSNMIAHLLDLEIKKLNDDYKSERSAMLGQPVVSVIPSEWFFEWKEMKGKLNGQSKIPRVLKNKNLEVWRSFIDRKLKNK